MHTAYNQQVSIRIQINLYRWILLPSFQKDKSYNWNLKNDKLYCGKLIYVRMFTFIQNNFQKIIFFYAISLISLEKKIYWISCLLLVCMCCLIVALPLAPLTHIFCVSFLISRSHKFYIWEFWNTFFHTLVKTQKFLIM